MDSFKLRTKVDIALYNTSGMLGLFIDEVFRTWKGDGVPWIEYLAERDRARHPQDIKLKFVEQYHAGDLSQQLRMLGTLCRDKRSPLRRRRGLGDVQGTAQQIKDLRNHFAHHYPITQDIADLVVGKCNDLLGWIGAPLVSEEQSETQLIELKQEYASVLKTLFAPKPIQREAPVPAARRRDETPEWWLRWLTNLYSDLSRGDGVDYLLYEATLDEEEV
jgi:hypothetical protein